MGEFEGEGIVIRWDPMEPEAGVASSDPELRDPEDADDTDMDRPLAFREAMGIGTEGLVFSGLSVEDIFSK
jgi:hypothetical protein